MADWQRVLNIKQEWKQAQENELTVTELAKVIVAKLEKLAPVSNSYATMKKEDLIEEFKTFIEDESDDVDTFDGVMEELYNWGDISLDDTFGGKKMCWIKTF